jgi:hypothetical protein
MPKVGGTGRGAVPPAQDTPGVAFKYRLAFVVNSVCVLRYDNEAGKGDHKHIGGEQKPYAFTTPAQLLEDFWNDVDRWRF